VPNSCFFGFYGCDIEATANCKTGLPDFSWYNIPKPENIFVGGRRPNGYKIYQNLSLQDTKKFTQIGLKLYYLATLLQYFGLQSFRKYTTATQNARETSTGHFIYSFF
jgi:hypothetical protein